jgi:hypothetical protein
VTLADRDATSDANVLNYVEYSALFRVRVRERAAGVGWRERVLTGLNGCRVALRALRVWVRLWEVGGKPLRLRQALVYVGINC